MERDEFLPSDAILKFMKDFDCEIVDDTDCDKDIINTQHVNDYEVKDNTIYLWRLRHGRHYDGDIYRELVRNPGIDTLYIGKDVTECGDMRQIQIIMQVSYNTIPAFRHIILEDTKEYESIDGILVDKSERAVIAYASGLTTSIIEVPDGITGLEEHCFNYNKYVRYLILPSSIQDIEGIESLPNLESVVIRGNGEGIYHTEDGIIFRSSQKQPLFIPPYHPVYPNAEAIDNLFDRLLSSVKTEAGKRRWKDVEEDCFSYDDEFKSSDGITLIYNGGLYLQFWTIKLDRLPTRIKIEYKIRNELSYWDGCCEPDYSDAYDCVSHDEFDVHRRLRCKECKHKCDCDAIYDSNRRYVGNLLKRLNAELSQDFHIDESENITCNLSIETSFDEVRRVLLSFLDIALAARIVYPILNIPPKPSLFEDSEFNELQDSPSQCGSPDCFPFTEDSIGFCHNKS